jgi:hypothetical protein
VLSGPVDERACGRYRATRNALRRSGGRTGPDSIENMFYSSVESPGRS